MAIGGGAGFVDAGALSLITDYGVLWVSAVLFSTPLAWRMYEKIIRGGRKWQIALNSVVYAVLFLLCVAEIVSGTESACLYF